jgi:ankyrin repeat protein
MGNYDSKNSIVNNVIDNVMNTDNLKLNKIIQNRYNSTFLEEIDKMLDNFNINTCNVNGENLLHIFARSSKISLLQMLVDRGCDINKKDTFGNTPIFYACEYTHEFFINNGIDLNIKNNKGHTVLYERSKYYYTSATKKLLNAQTCEDIYDQFEKYELLHKAVLFQDIPKMKELMTENKFLVNSIIEDSNPCRTKQLLTPLSIACQNSLYDEFLYLIENGADIHQNNSLLNMQYWNTGYNHINIIKKLIELGANINDVNDYGENVLHRINCSKNIELFEIFLKAGANIHAKTLPNILNEPTHNRYSHLVLSNATPLHCASVFNYDIQVYKLLFEYGADPNVQNNYGISSFMGICTNIFFRFNNIDNTLEIIQLFIDNGADIYLIDNFGNNALDLIIHNIYIIDEMKVKIIKYLHEKFKFMITTQKTNKFLYDVLLKDKIKEK